MAHRSDNNGRRHIVYHFCVDSESVVSLEDFQNKLRSNLKMLGATSLDMATTITSLGAHSAEKGFLEAA